MVRAITVLIALAACTDDPPPSVAAAATRELADDALFHQDPRWLGGDAAYTIDLGNDRSLWLFGDSFIATSPANVRTQSTMVRNSIALMTGHDIATATMQFAWRDGTPPTSYFGSGNDHWFWPGGGARAPNGSAIIFLSELRPTPNQGLGFAGVGFSAVRIADPSGAIDTWELHPTNVRAPNFAQTSNVACTTVVDDYVIAIVTDDTTHDGYLARWPLAELDLAGDLSNPSWWTGAAWTPETSLAGAPTVVVPDGATECSIHYDDTTRTWVYLWSRGFGGTTLAIRTSPAITGPWSTPYDVLKPPESDVANAFVYAGKAHPHLRTANGSVLVTFADNSFTFSDLFDPARASTLYWPHVVHLQLRPR